MDHTDLAPDETDNAKLSAGTSSENAANPLAEQVYQRLKLDIFNFRLLPGDRFSENGIAQYYGVSRTPMRDGLFRLQREGYLEVGFRRGWKVAPINFEQLDALYDLRIVLELAAFERIAGGDAPHTAIAMLKAIWCID
ncbi:MAG TPA: GntR family transcriptional regulator, partial [Pararobbsia sp.]|nr:GntR family transcriptional regulator [Pararobbsia sp.]